jgi:biotin synthase
MNAPNRGSAALSPTAEATEFLATLSAKAFASTISQNDLERVLVDPELDLLPLLHAAYAVRRQHFGNTVQVHIINNAANGHCPEDCGYCSQARSSDVDIEKYPPKSEVEILEEARRAYEAGAYRYCMVYAGRGPSARRTEQLAALVRAIKERYPIQVCISAGLLDAEKAAVLQAAGLDRYNHNLNTSEANYPSICTTHTYQDRVDTLSAARQSGLALCSGMIVGMGESTAEVVEVILRLRTLRAESIPVNFLLPFEGATFKATQALTPNYVLRVLCAFRLGNPSAELRIAAGREHHLRSLQPLALYPCNSLFLEGYLNSRGSTARDTLMMIRDAGFEIASDVDLSGLLGPEPRPGDFVPATALKSRRDLRPALD